MLHLALEQVVDVLVVGVVVDGLHMLDPALKHRLDPRRVVVRVLDGVAGLQQGCVEGDVQVLLGCLLVVVGNQIVELLDERVVDEGRYDALILVDVEVVLRRGRIGSKCFSTFAARP